MIKKTTMLIVIFAFLMVFGCSQQNETVTSDDLLEDATVDEIGSVVDEEVDDLDVLFEETESLDDLDEELAILDDLELE